MSQHECCRAIGCMKLGEERLQMRKQRYTNNNNDSSRSEKCDAGQNGVPSMCKVGKESKNRHIEEQS